MLDRYKLKPLDREASRGCDAVRALSLEEFHADMQELSDDTPGFQAALARAEPIAAMEYLLERGFDFRFTQYEQEVVLFAFRDQSVVVAKLRSETNPTMTMIGVMQTSLSWEEIRRIFLDPRENIAFETHFAELLLLVDNWRKTNNIGQTSMMTAALTLAAGAAHEYKYSCESIRRELCSLFHTSEGLPIMIERAQAELNKETKQ